MSQTLSTKEILKKLTAFSVPLILSGLLQQLFNWVDALIVGNTVGEIALTGVGATSSVYNLFVTVIVGFTSGLSVLAAQRFGSGRKEDNKDILGSYTLILAALCIIVSALGMVLVEPILSAMNTSEAAYSFAKDYLFFIFIGIPFLAVYNTYSAVLRGIGNSKIPFFAVLISSVTNVILDLLFVVVCDLGVAGASIATVLSQIAMTVFIVIYTCVKYPFLRFSPFRIKVFHSTTLEGARYGLPIAIQSGVGSVGNLILQRFMNGLGDQTVAAITTAYRVDSVLLLPIINFSTAISTLVAQEYGARQTQSAKKILRLGTVMMSIISVSLTVVILFCGKPLLSIFGLGDKAVLIGKRFFETISIFYLVYGLSMSVKGYLEGISDMIFSGIIGIASLIIRIAASYGLVHIFGNMVVAYAEAISWMFLLTAFTCRYFIKKNRI